MGNRAVICFENKQSAVGIYVHWNGGPESILAFLHEAERRGYRTPEGDPTYAMARLIGLICDYFGGTNSIGVGQLKTLDCDNGNNGLYVVGPGWCIKTREHNGSDYAKTVEDLDKNARKQYDGMRVELQKLAERREAE